MTTDVSLHQRYRDQEIAIARLMAECQVLRDENADLVDQLELARNPGVAEGYERLEATLRVEVRDPGTNGDSGGFGLQLVDKIATRWGVNRTGGTHVWFEVDAVGATD